MHPSASAAWDPVAFKTLRVGHEALQENGRHRTEPDATGYVVGWSMGILVSGVQSGVSLDRERSPHDPTVRRRLNEEWNNSKAEGKERGGWVYRDPATGEYVVDVHDVARTRCYVAISPIPVDKPGYTPVGPWHTHIVLPETTGEALIPDCPNLPPGFVVVNGYSGPDRFITDQSGKPHFLIDDNNLFVQYPTNVGGGTFEYPWIANCRATA